MKGFNTNRISRKQFLKLMASGSIILFLGFIPGFRGGIREMFSVLNPTASTRGAATMSQTKLESFGQTNLATEGNSGPPIFNNDRSVTYPIKFITDGSYTETRTLLKVEMQVKDGSWRSAVFNLDTGATVTDVPPTLLKPLGLKVDETRPQKDIKIRFPGMPAFTLTCTVPDQDHYETLTNGTRHYPLMKTEDMMKYMSIVFEKRKTTFRQRSLGAPPQINNPLALGLSDAVRRSGTPTSSKYWYRWKAYPPSKSSRAQTDWWLLDTGANSVLVKKSYADNIGLVRESKIADGRYRSTISVEFAQGKNFTAKCEIRSDSLQFARGGPPRNLGGRIGFLDSWSIVVWDNHVALIPVTV